MSSYGSKEYLREVFKEYVENHLYSDEEVKHEGVGAFEVD